MDPDNGAGTTDLLVPNYEVRVFRRTRLSSSCVRKTLFCSTFEIFDSQREQGRTKAKTGGVRKLVPYMFPYMKSRPKKLISRRYSLNHKILNDREKTDAGSDARRRCF
jgi:hypothetical protein